jgi:opacity protein-like surface antigen
VADLNTGAQGLSDYFADTLASSPDSVVGPLHLAYLLGTEFQGELRPGLFLGIGIDALRGSRETLVQYSGSGERAAYTTRPEIRALPLRVVVSYFVHPRLYLKVGLEYYLAQARYSYRLEQGETWEEWQGKASAQGFGFMGGLGLETEINPNIGFFAEVTGHLAKLSDFEGTDTHVLSGGSEVEEDGKLYIYQGHVSPETSYPLVYIRERKPAEAGVSDAQLASVDLSGLVLRLGFTFRF